MPLTMGLMGCASTSNTPQPPELAPMEQAILDLDEAKRLNAQWMVRNPFKPHESISLTQLLSLAVQYQLSEDHSTAIFLAQEVSKYAKLGIAQALSQPNPSPNYLF